MPEESEGTAGVSEGLATALRQCLLSPQNVTSDAKASKMDEEKIVYTTSSVANTSSGLGCLFFFP